MQFALFVIFVGLLMALAYYDVMKRRLPDILNFSLLWLGLLGNPVLGFVSLYAAIIGVVVGYMVLFFLYWVFKWLCHKEGLGYGDFKMLAALGAWFGWQMLPFLLLLASSGTLIVLFILKLCKRYPQDSQIPFGIGLAAAGLAIFLYKMLTST